MFKIVWDPEYNGVRLTMSAKGDALNVSPRPVFCEELNLLGLDRMGWNYPPQIEEPLLWACDRRYYYKGEFVLEVKGGNLFDAPTVIIQPGFGSLALEPVDMERLRSRNEDTLFNVLIHSTFIRERQENIAHVFCMRCPLFSNTRGNENYPLADMPRKSYFCLINQVGGYTPP